MIIKWEEACREIDNLKKTVRELHQENKNLSTIITSQGEDIFVLTSKSEELAKFVKAQNILDRILEDEEKSRIGVELIKYLKVKENKLRNSVAI